MRAGRRRLEGRLRRHAELVRDTSATFFSTLDHIESLGPADAVLVRDDSPDFRRSRLWVEAVLRKTPVPLHDPGSPSARSMVLDALDFQRQAVAQALDPKRLRPRLLIADAVGLGKTLEIGMILAELIRRGRGERILVVTPRHVLEQMQHELWTGSRSRSSGSTPTASSACASSSRRAATRSPTTQGDRLDRHPQDPARYRATWSATAGTSW